jgi:CRISPR/Cas system-associated endoribonuclease Cas2
MRSTTMSALLVALLASTVAWPAAAAERERGINARQNMQQHRIQHGVRQGDLTRGEARRLRGEVRSVQREERAFRADGNLNAGERRHLNRDLNQVSRDIRRERHDDQRRFGYRGSDQRFAYRGQGHAFGRHGADRRFWAHGADHRFGRHGEHPRFGNLWGHRSQGSRIDRMQAQQRQRIMQGVRSGELTQREVRRLRAEQRMIRREERAYFADGYLSPAERRDLYRDLRAANGHIYNQTHDAQTRR